MFLLTLIMKVKPIYNRKRKDFDWITLFFSYTFQTKQRKNIKNVNDLKIYLILIKKLINKWKIYDNYMLSAYKKMKRNIILRKNLSMNEVQHIPIIFR